MSKQKCLDQVIHDASSRIFSVEAGWTVYGEMSTFEVLGLRLGRKILLTTYHSTSRSYGKWIDDGEGYGIVDRVIADPADAHGEIARIMEGFENPELDADIAGKVAKLPDSTARFGAMLDRRYEPSEGVAAAKPSRLIRAVFSGEEAYEAPCWAWFDRAVHLTACRFVRGVGSSRQARFDDALKGICEALGLKVETVILGEEEFDGDHIRRTRLAVVSHRRASLAAEVSVREEAITICRRDIARCRLEIAARRERLGALDERLSSIRGGRGHE